MQLSTRELLSKWLRSKVTLITFVTLVFSLALYIFTIDSASIWQRVLNALALGMVPTCLIGLIWELSVRSSFLVYADDLITTTIQQESATSRDGWASTMVELTQACGPSSVSVKYGLAEGFDNRTAVDLPRVIGQAESRVWLQLTSFSYLTETPGLVDTLAKKHAQGVDIRILGLAPDSGAAQLRSKTGVRYAQLSEEIVLHLKKLREELEQHGAPAGLAPRLYAAPPTVAFFIVDNQLYFCVLLVGVSGRDSVHLRVASATSGRRSKLFSEFETHFETLYSGATEYTDARGIAPSLDDHAGAAV